MQVERALSAALLVAACLTAGGQSALQRQPPLRTLTTAREVHSLPVEQAARGYPVHLRAVVTYYDPYIDSRHGALFVCDRSGCIFVSVPQRPILPIQASDSIDIRGVSGPGDYAPVVTGQQVQFTAKSHLPRNAPRAAMSPLLIGVFDAQWVQVEGRVRNVHIEPHNVVLEIASEGGSFSAVTLREPGADYEALIDSLVRIRANAAPVFNQNRQMVGVHVFFPSLYELSVLEKAPPDPFGLPAIPVRDLFLFSPNPGILHRVHVQGRVTLDWPGHLLCILDGQDGICMQTGQAAGVAVGTFVDVVGFPGISVLKPTLEDAEFRAAGGPAVLAVPLTITAAEAVRGGLDGKLVQIDGDLIGRNLSTADTTLLLRDGRVLFPVILSQAAVNADVLPWKDGSRLHITGVLNVQVDPLSTNLGEGAVRPGSMRILLRSTSDVTVVHTPSWWTPGHTLEIFSAVGLLILAAIAWIVVLRHRVEQQTRALRKSEERLRHLSEHDVLTALPNRLLLEDRLRTSLQRVERFQTCLGLLMADVDGFKEVNDALGHQAGDKLLCELAGRLRACVRGTDTVARIGGDEFVVLLPDLRMPAEAETIARKIVVAVTHPFEIDHALTSISISVGIVTYPEGSSDPETLMHCADQAMYAAKQKGKNRFQVFRPDHLRFDGNIGQPSRQATRNPVTS
jgi:diguanylate cyclase (GGDEF)-like protein